MSKHHSARRYFWFVLWVASLAERHPRLYLSISVLVMLWGYAFLVLFPFLVIEGVSVLARQLPHVKTAEHWIVVEVWFALLLFFLFFSQQVFQLRFPRVKGLKLSKELAPGLYELIAAMRKFSPRPSIRSIVLTDQYELRIEETPRFGYPFWTTNTLIIGLPMLQTLTEEQLRGEVLRRLCQYSSGRFRPSHWLFRTRLLWRKYLDAMSQRKRFGETPVRWFFSIYAPFFEMLTLPAARMDELEADGAVLEWLNDRDYFEVIKSSAIAKLFLDAHYWRKVQQSALKNPDAELSPFEKLEHVSGHLKSRDFRRKCLQHALEAEQEFHEVMPCLRTRMENIGQSTLREVPVVAETAAEACLGEARKNYVPLIDKLWRSTTLADWKADYATRCADYGKAKELSRKSRQQVLNIKEMLCYARLAKQLRGDSMRKTLWKALKRNVKNILPEGLSRHVFQRKVPASQQANDIL